MRSTSATRSGHSPSSPSPRASRQDADAIDEAARALLRAHRRVMLAVSGGQDSMVLLHAVTGAAAQSRRLDHVSVATFDHGTGAAATRAAALVRRECARLNVAVRVGHARLARGTEAQWREARWRFLRTQGSHAGAVVATAHTRDDQIETVVMRAMRGAGARGLAGLLDTAGVTRPLVGIGRDAIARYAREHQVPFIDDPSNASRLFLRNRIRLDLLPAIRRVRPRFEDEMLALARAASAWRAAVDELAARFVEGSGPGGLRVARAELATYDSEALRILWPAIAARANVTLDRRGTLRLAQFTIAGATGGRVQLSGGAEVIRENQTFLLRRRSFHCAPIEPLSLAGVVEFGAFRFRPVDPERAPAGESSETAGEPFTSDPWVAELPADRVLTVRSWAPGDRMRHSGLGAARRVKRFFADARVPRADREGWPVVVADGDEIVWIPGVRRSDAATDRSGRPVIRYACERFDG